MHGFRVLSLWLAPAVLAAFGLAFAAVAGFRQTSRPEVAAGPPVPPSRVRIVPAAPPGPGGEAGWRLLRDGRPYFIKGAGGADHLAELVRAGGNSIRTWGAEDMEGLLDRAHRLGLTVTLGIWLGHEAHGFRYDDPEQVRKQRDQAKAFVLRYKDHPALLMWGLGNEMEGSGENPRIWNAIEEIARIVKQVDPHHPTMTVLAEVSDTKIAALKRHCPSLDLLGVNSYGGLRSLPERLGTFGWNKPWVVTEFGPLGPWEVGKTAWGAPVEPSSTAKARFYAEGYERAIVPEAGRCLGSYVFLWGHKVEATHTWFGMFLPPLGDGSWGGERLGAVDAMTRLWTGKPPRNRAPEIAAFGMGGTGGGVAGPAEVKPGSAQRAVLDARDPDGDAVSIRWEVRNEKEGPASFEPGQAAPPVRLQGAVTPAPDAAASSWDLTAPQREGAYRLFVYVFDGRGSAATANVPFLVKAEAREVSK